MKRFRSKINGAECTVARFSDINPNELYGQLVIEYFSLEKDSVGYFLRPPQKQIRMSSLPFAPRYICPDALLVRSGSDIWTCDPKIFEEHFEPIRSETQTERKPFITAEVREIMDKLFRDEITYNKMVELLNDHVYEWLKKNGYQIVDNPSQ